MADPADQLRPLYERWFAAVRARDHAAVDALLADDWVYTNWLGEVRGKREYYAYLDGIDALPELALYELDARLHGSLALAWGRYAGRGGPELRFTAVWRRGEDGWRCLAHQTTAIVEDTAP